ncbi:9705_t:CDS:2 [Gigaspora rosea]|nr:9705_t:CDS:2 [Gigaspora rosea]
MYEDIKNYVQTCDICQHRGHEVRRQDLQPLEAKYPFYKIGINIKEPLPVTKQGNKYIIVAMNYLTKWPEARAVFDIKAITIAKFIYKEIICRYRTPTIILTDRGTNFMSDIIKNYVITFKNEPNYIKIEIDHHNISITNHEGIVTTSLIEEISQENNPSTSNNNLDELFEKFINDKT